MRPRLHLLAGALVLGAHFLPSVAVAQGVTATAVAHTGLSVAASPFTQSVPAGTNLTPGVNLSVNAGPAFDSGSAGLEVSLVQQPTITYRIDAEATSLDVPNSLPSPSCSYGGETRLTITPQGGQLVGVLRVTFGFQGGFGAASGNAAIDIGNDGSIDWTNTPTGSPQVFETTVVQGGALVIRTITSASVAPGGSGGFTSFRDGDLVIEFFPTTFTATAVAHTSLSVASGFSSQGLPAGTNLAAGVSLIASASPPYATGSASMGVSLTSVPSLSYEVSNGASSSSNPLQPQNPPPDSSSSGETLLTISPLTGFLSGRLRITFTWSPFGLPGGASVDLGNDGWIDWVGSSSGSNPQVHEIPIGQTTPLLVRTITSAFRGSSALGVRTVDLQIEYLPTTSWNESGDAGDSRPTAQIPRGLGPIESIAGTLGSSDCDMFWIQIDDPQTFSATTVGGASFDTQLWLFDRRGYGVSFNDDDPAGGVQSTLTDTYVHSPGKYLLAVTRYDRDAASAGGAIWNDGPFNVERQPDGPGAGSPLMNWSGTTSSAGAYTIFLTGVSFPDMGRLIAVDGNRNLFEFDSASGARTQIGVVSANAGSPRGLAYDSMRGVLYLLSSTASLYTVDLATSAATLIGPAGGSPQFASLEFDPSTGSLYAVNSNDSSLYRIDTTTGTAQLIGPTGLPPGNSSLLSYDPRSNTLHAMMGGNWFQIDRATGSAWPIPTPTLSIIAPNCAAMHAGTGLIHTIGLSISTLAQNLYSTDVETATATAIGPTGGGMQGLAHLPTRRGAADFGTGCAGQGGVTPVLRAVGPFPHPGTMTYELTGVAPLSLGFFAFGTESAWLPLPFPGACPLHILPLLAIEGLFVTGPGGPGSGSGSFTLPLPPGAVGLQLTAQGVVLESLDLDQLRTSNGVQILL